MVLVMLHLRGLGIRGRVVWQTDRGVEFGGSDSGRISERQRKYYHPLGVVLARYPKGRKGYNGRVERSHRTDDEEFYIPCLLDIEDDGGLLRKAAAWLYYYNLRRPHQGAGMRGLPPFQRLQWRRKHKLPRSLSLLPPVLLDTVSADMAVKTGNDVLTLYRYQGRSAFRASVTDAADSATGRIPGLRQACQTGGWSREVSLASLLSTHRRL